MQEDFFPPVFGRMKPGSPCRHTSGLIAPGSISTSTRSLPFRAAFPATRGGRRGARLAPRLLPVPGPHTSPAVPSDQVELQFALADNATE